MYIRRYMYTATRRRVPTLLISVVMMSATAMTALAGAPTNVNTSGSSCDYPGSVVQDRWMALATPVGVRLGPVQQLDQYPCVLISVDAEGRPWRSNDAGVHWRGTASGTELTRVFGERLQPLAGGRAVGPVLAVGPTEDAISTSPYQVYVSDDNGTSFNRARLVVGVPATATDDQAIPLRMNVRAAVTAVRYDNGVARPDVYVAGRVTALGSPAGSAGNVRALLESSDAPALLKSNDGGHTFRVVTAAQQLTVSAIAVNPTSPEEVWVNDIRPNGLGGGVLVSYDGGASFRTACCADVSVSDIAISVLPDGGMSILLATSGGLMRSVDDGKTWERITDTAFTEVRTPADDASTMVATIGRRVVLSTGQAINFKPLLGLPGSCEPHGLRRNERLPSTFLVDCGGQTYRLILSQYASSFRPLETLASPPTVTPPDPDLGMRKRPLVELAQVSLPGSNPSSGAVAFDGKVLYYDMQTAGDIGRVRASDGAFLGVWRTGLTGVNVLGLTIMSLTTDLRRNQLLLSSATTAELFSLDLATRKLTRLGTTPTTAPTYDSFTDGLSWVPEYKTSLYRRSRQGSDPGQKVCRVANLPQYEDGTPVNADTTSTFTAAGDGGGYIQLEDDATLWRIDRKCRVVQTYSHRVFSEPAAENDSLACDTQSFYPQPAIWIRDSEPQAATAYGVPFGYCPMPSQLTLAVPRDVLGGSATSLCATLVNRTNRDAAQNRSLEFAVSGVVVGRGQTDDAGRVCQPYVPLGGFVGKRQLALSVSFAGDAALYPASAKATLLVLDVPPGNAPPHQVIPVAPPPYIPPIPSNPLPIPGPAGAAQLAPAPNVANAPAAQAQANTQPVSQAVVVPQRQQQPQLVLARAALRIGLDGNQMVAPSRGARAPVPLSGVAVAGLLAMSCVAMGVCAAAHPVRARSRAERRGIRPPIARRWR